jgi:hypothetical protein
MSGRIWKPSEQLSGYRFVEKLQAAVEIELDYWQRDGNLPVKVFLAVLPHMPKGVKVDWAPRKSGDGDHGHHGEDSVWKSEFVAMLPLGTKGTYFIKGYFFTKSTLEGVTIQSFREVTQSPIPLKKE